MIVMDVQTYTMLRRYKVIRQRERAKRTGLLYFAYSRNNDVLVELGKKGNFYEYVQIPLYDCLTKLWSNRNRKIIIGNLREDFSLWFRRGKTLEKTTDIVRFATMALSIKAQGAMLRETESFWKILKNQIY